MIVALPQQPRLLRRNVVELDQHALHSHRATVKLASKHQGAVTSGAQLVLRVDLDVPHTDDRARHGLHVVGHRPDVGLNQIGCVAQPLRVLDGLINRGRRRFVVARL